ncbi:pyruvoyl-dependent arginine decarboxylase [Halopenitus persicus]|uniref:arginine decarboxylase n=1 Tax=Halopenitus persicus TaxID=1048396 RepID=A0A1H3KY94_9EURY|nr:pyruvoyl-dependent arginine decarboxylase [Halopenitus persicus]QHS18040.1 pyruvoyl-dependent arginine decarboxylase subunit alpha [haloarchaeon 3A1-DGR]SDY56969.1 arginine decarboxylase [Halopenitus persicus]
MASIHVAAGVGVAPTAMAAYDAALADANLHNYNLVTVSSIVPADATVTSVDRAPDLGPAGNRLTVVQAKRHLGPATSAGSTTGAEPTSSAESTTGAEPDADRPSTIAAGLGWATGPGPGLFYEVPGTEPEAVRDRIHEGLDAGATLRDWDLPDRETLVESATPSPDAHTCVVVVAAYGDSEPIV